MPGARQRDILAAFTEAQELLRSGRVGLNDALLHPHARPMSAPPRATLSAALQLALGRSRSSTAPPRRTQRPTATTGATAELKQGDEKIIFSSPWLAHIGEEAEADGTGRVAQHLPRALPAKRPQSAAARSSPARDTEIELVRTLRDTPGALRNPRQIRHFNFDPVINGIGGSAPSQTAHSALFRRYAAEGSAARRV
ncbi:hypothetical protein T492DRAFT_848015 [Pavlovales sp. CCMP2436]|nr:hypothetical protein T492DRAFT_848015 [Pavlovales sp. CCMP2436]